MKKTLSETGFDKTAFMAAMRAAANPKPLQIDVDGLGVCYVRAITAGQGSELAGMDSVDKKYENVRNVAIVLCDADGNLLFDAKNEGDLELLSQQKAGAINAILQAANKHNGWNSEAVKKG
jgi:hypothetical protein